MNKRILKYNFSLLNTDHVKLGTRWNYNNVVSPYHRIYYIDEGDGEISSINKILKLEPGNLYLIPSFTLCNLHCGSYLSQYFVQFFEDSADGVSLFDNKRSVFKVEATNVDAANFKRLITINPGRGINRSDNPKVYEKQLYYNEYQELNNHQHITSFLETQGILLQLVSRFAALEGYNQKEMQIPVKTLEAIRYINVNLSVKLSVQMLAQRANHHSDYFSRLFAEHTGLRPAAYITEKRIERAQYLIATTQAGYAEIAELTGFDSLAHFSRTFKRITGRSPSAYKMQLYL